MKLYQRIAFLADNEHLDRDGIEDQLPSGSGFDNGTRVVWEESSRNKVVLETSYHHLNENGFYTHWTEHRIIITPDLPFGFKMDTSGDDNVSGMFYDYLADLFYDVLNSEAETPVRG